MFTVEFKMTGNALAGLQNLSGLIKDRKGLLQAVGLRGISVLKKWFLGLDVSKRNRNFRTRTHFWKDVARAVQPTPRIEGNAAVIFIGHPVISHKVGLGPAAGIIRPVRAQWLTIPVVEEAYGKTTAEFVESNHQQQLIFIQRSQVMAFLGQVVILDGSGPRGGEVRSLKIIYILRKEVYQAPESDSLPDDSTWENSLIDEGVNFLVAELAKTAP